MKYSFFFFLTLGMALLLFGCTNTPNPDQNATLPVFTQNHLQVFVIQEESCSNCFSIQSVLNSLTENKKYVIDETKTISFDTIEGKNWVIDYNITSLPTVIVKGTIKEDLQNAWLQSNLGTIDNNVLVLRQKKFPYFDPVAKRIRGQVEMIVLYDSNCADLCRPILPTITRDINGLAVMNAPIEIAGSDTGESQTIFVSSIQFLDVWSVQGQERVNAWEVTRVPVVALSKEAEDYEYFKLHSGDAGFVNQSDGWLVNSTNPPFIDLVTGKVRGLVNVTFINDASCPNCLNGEIAYRQFLDQYMVRMQDVNSFDWNSTKGIELVKKYQLTQVPTIILTSEVVYYTQLADEWMRVWGTIEDDGNFVFRSVKQFTELSLDRNVTYTAIDLNQLD